MALIEVVDDHVLKIGEYPPLELRLVDGRSFDAEILFAKGAPENPLSDAELEEKAVSLIVPVLGTARCRQLMTSIAHLDELDDVRELTGLLVPESEARGAA